MKRFSLQDLNNLPRVERAWVVEQMIRAGRRPFIICGSPEAGKSTLAQQMTKAVARGDDFLGRKTTQGRVIYWQSEEDEQDAAEDFALGTNPSDPILVLHPSIHDNNFAELKKAIRDYPDTRLVIIETLMAFFKSEDIDQGPENNKKFGQLQEVMGQFPQCAFGLLHWFKKSDSQKTGLSIHKMLGSTVIAGDTSAKIFLQEVSDNDSRRVIQIRTRKGVKVEPTYLNFDAETKTSTLGIPVALEKAERRFLVGEQQKVAKQTNLLAVIAENRKANVTEIHELVGGRKDNLLIELGLLEQAGKIFSLPKQGPRKNENQYAIVQGGTDELFERFEAATYDPRAMAMFYGNLPTKEKELVWNKFPDQKDALKEYAQ